MNTGFMGTGATQNGSQGIKIGIMSCGANENAGPVLSGGDRIPPAPIEATLADIEAMNKAMEALAPKKISEPAPGVVLVQPKEAAEVTSVGIEQKTIETQEEKVDNAVEDLQTLYPSQLKSMALKKGYKGDDFSKITLIEFLKTN